MSIPRENAKSMVSKLGGHVTTAPSSKTSFLVTGSDPGPSKLAKAKVLQIKIINESEFLALIAQYSQNFDDTLRVDISSLKKNSNSTENNPCTLMWVEKYTPKISDNIVGNSNIINQLKDFLNGKTEFKAVLLSGNPGIGKTSCAHLVSKELGFKVIEFNASDLRNKKAMNENMYGLNFLSLNMEGKLKKKVIIMDEIDGMTSDRGGLTELNSLIKKTKTYIICLCNDRSNLKLQTIGRNCLDLRFRKLLPAQIMPRLKYILEKEGKQIRDNILKEIIENSSGDLRFCINTLQNIALRETISHEEISHYIKKSVTKSIFEIVKEIFLKKKITEKLDLYFEDYTFVPLFIQDNYLKLNFRNIFEIRRSAESLSYSDIIDKRIHGPNQERMLMPLHAFYSSILPVYNKSLTKRIDYPAFFGKRSKKMKNFRILSETHLHGFKHFTPNKTEFRLYCLDLIFKKMVNYLANSAISECVKLLVDYDLLKTDYENLIALAFEGETLVKNIGTKNKSAFTKLYKSINRDLPYHVLDVKKITNPENEDEDID